MIAPWLQRILDERNPDGVTRRVRATHCRDCGATILRGLDAETAALPVACDPNPIGALGETIALVTGRGTYSLTWRGDRYEIDHRNRWSISGHPPDGLHVVAEHRCGMLLPTRGETAKPKEKANIECPF